MAAEFSSRWIPELTTPSSPCFVNVYDALADTSLGLAPELDSGDGQDPNDVGHAVLFSTIVPMVTAYVCSKTTRR